MLGLRNLILFVGSSALTIVACSSSSGSGRGGGRGVGTAANTGTGNGSGTGATGATGGTGAGGPVIVPPTVVSANCGNSILDDGELCDDGNTDGGDGCSPACRVEADYDCVTPGQPCISNAVCGNGSLSSAEACDDGNTTPGDGCAADCSAVDPGWQCRVPGKKCVPLCGDGVLTGTENCDDANVVNGDGCSETCLVEAGSTCDNSTLPSQCTQSVCGNGLVEAGETCDKGSDNGLFYGDGSGCSKTCTVEPTCRGDDGVTRACDTHCGDGNIDDGEECDDGNQLDGDGCSHDCKPEGGFTCTPMEKPDTVPCPSNPQLQCLVLPMIFRDFDPSTNPDFFYYGKNGVTCVPDASGTAPPAFTAGAACPATDQAGPCLGLAGATLDKDGKPGPGTTSMCRCVFTDHDDTGVIASAPTCTRGDGSTRHHIDTMITTVNDIKTWYAGDGLHGTLELAQSGTQYQFSSSVMGAVAGTAGSTITDDIHSNCLGTATPLQSGFFPFDATTDGMGAGTEYCNLWPYWALGTSEANCVTGPDLTIKGQWDPMAAYDNCPMTGTDGSFVPRSDGMGTPLQGGMHDFYYTTEARYLFRYAGPASLSFFGDDDVFVYINGKLKLDLGAPHERLMGTATIGDATDGLEMGKIYEIAVFHADRHPRDANYQLTLSSFSTTESNCMPTCGDGVATAGEECDLGTAMNTGEYGGCTAECKFGPFCGDGEVNGSEECDLGRQNGAAVYGADGCTSACLRPHRCGDGIIDGGFGEECDDGDNNGVRDCDVLCHLPVT